jgi:glutaredoxin
MASQETAAEKLQVTLYTKPGCHLCDDLRDLLQAMQAGLDFAIVERNIETEPADFERYRYLIPVLDVPGHEPMTPPHETLSVRRALQAALSATGSQA